MPFQMMIDRFVARGLAPGLLTACLLLGGASGAGEIANAVLQLLALLVILLLAARPMSALASPAARALLLLAAAAIAWMLIQLLPLPPSIWGLLPGRAHVWDGYRMAGMTPPWLPLTLAPEGTIAALLSLLPPLAMFLATIAASSAGRRYAVYMLVGGATASILLGMLQELHAVDYIYAFTSFGGAVGFFANRNHLGTLCLMAMPLGAALAVSGGGAALDRRIGRRLIAGSAIAFLALGVIIVESIACWMLLAPTLIGCFLVYERGNRGALRKRTATVGSIVAAAGLIAAVYASFTVGDLNQQATGIDPHERRESIRLTYRAAGDFLPFGSGMGSFPDIYPSYENPEGVTLTYVNHAHSDYVELLLESGLTGAVLLGAFLLWWLRGFWPVWKPRSERSSYARAAFFSIAAPLAHSLVDYPFRTAAIAAAAAFACGLLVSQDSERTEPADGRRSRNMRDDRTIMLGLLPAASASETPSRSLLRTGI